MAFCPLLAASMLVYRESKVAGVKAPLQRLDQRSDAPNRRP